MATSVDEIKAAIGEFIVLVEDGVIPADERMRRLRRSLDQLALLHHDVSYTFDERDYPDPAHGRDYQAIRRMVSAQFPKLGFYNVPSAVTQQIATASVHVGDAIDDIADIAGELYEVVWRFDHTSGGDALWHFSHGYTTHWEAHLRELQLYLQRIGAGHEDATDQSL